jgi:hypothetical protein
MSSDGWFVVLVLSLTLMCCGEPDVLDGLAKKANQQDCQQAKEERP